MDYQLASTEDLLLELNAARKRVAELELRLSQPPDKPLSAEPIWQESLGNLTSLINSTGEFIWVVDKQKRLLFANDATRKNFRTVFAVDMQLGMTSADLLPADRAEYYDRIYAKALKGKRLKLIHSGLDGRTYAVTVQPVKKTNQIVGVSVFARDITHQQQLEQDLRHFEQIIASTPDMVSLIDQDYRYCLVNDAYLTNFNLKRTDIIGKTILDLVGEEHFKTISEPSLKKAFAGQAVHIEGWMEVPRLGRRFLAVTYHPLHGEKSPRFVAIDARDMTSLKRAEEDRQRIFDVSLDMLSVAGFDGYFKELNPAWLQTLGWSIDEMKSKPWLDFVAPEDQQMTIKVGQRLAAGHQIVGFENRFLCKDGSRRWMSWNAFPDPERQRIFAISRDVTGKKNLESELRLLATTDPLTGASNRRHFIERSSAELKRSRRYGATLAVVMLDIDYFKLVNDNYGHDAGDEVLTRLVDCCLQELRETDIFGRFGGEEFAAVLVQTDEEAAMCTCRRLRKQAEKLRVKTRQGEIKISVSIGLTMLSADDLSLNTLLKRADDALYRAKNQGRNQIVKI